METLAKEKEQKKVKGIYRRGDIWYIDYCYHDRYGIKRRVREAIGPSKKQAEQIRAKRITQAVENKHLDVQKEEKIKFKDFAQEYLEKHSKVDNRSWQSDEHRLRNLCKFFGEKYLFEITALDIQNYKTERLKEAAPATVNRCVAVLRSALNRAIEWGKLHQGNPASKIKRLRENNESLRFLTREEIERLYANCQGEILALVKFALGTGCRRGEIMDLTWQDVDLEQGKIHIRNSKSGKGRAIPMNQTVREVVLSLRKQPDRPQIFSSWRYELRRQFEQALRRANIKGASFHTLRHSFASHAVMRGIDIVTVSRLLGHSTIQMTMRYAKISRDHAEKAISALDEVIGSGEKHVTNMPQIDSRETPSGAKEVVTNLINYS